MTTIWPCESVGTRHSSSHSWNEAAFHRAVVDLRRREPSKAQTVNEGDRLVMAVRDGGPQSPSVPAASMRASETVEAPVSPTKTSLAGLRSSWRANQVPALLQNIRASLLLGMRGLF